jgi:hypothetical protein
MIVTDRVREWCLAMAGLCKVHKDQALVILAELQTNDELLAETMALAARKGGPDEDAGLEFYQTNIGGAWMHAGSHYPTEGLAHLPEPNAPDLDSLQ